MGCHPGRWRCDSSVVLITGAAGGLGRGLVEAFATAGWRVAAGFRRTACPRNDDTVWPVSLEVTAPERASQVIEEIVARWGRVDALVNNAGLTADASVLQMSDEAWQRVLDVNLKGAMACARAAVWPMIRQRDGHIINVSSFAARAGTPGQANYAAAKAALIGLTQSLAAELGSRNVRVNAVLPGVLPTGMTARLKAEARERLVTGNVLRRMNSVAEVARFVAFLAGMRDVSGQVFQLDSRLSRWG